MTDCCQGTSSPTGKLCGDCPHKKPAPLNDMSPEAVGRRLRESNLRGDEPWPGYSGGREIKKPQAEDDGIVEGYGQIPPAPPPVDDDPTDVFFDTLMKNFADIMGMTFDEVKDMLSKPFTGGVVGEPGEVFRIGEGVFHTGGIYAPGSVPIPCEFKPFSETVVPNITITYVSPEESYLEKLPGCRCPECAPQY